ncbi:alpha-galactosidase (plasmid) [Pseudoalteromonas nigrifaciens]|uniref:alpha-galactosidase n=1 Tax=Pseudoalteromonas nigrifaciens TaxID=28109 RepID=A0AAC9UNK9_9GAMM|nr:MULTISPECIES: alpha-galactosidase [Pseudoalteromonas]ASM56319.1 alpha-galactosidase [Pseudoalteromonas nigrifaciens]PCC09910.1 alpha-galactosidase [Pseudoalteromonas sp. JB197]SJN41205.1 Alpha-galactosidase [Pseudoalteromonas sp. JB197]SUD25083.1 Alpha-galactosidase [Pseudoalteromonas nigrifaciens]GEN43285.1 alpha-galactosidase [Pseudoalteromonas nigrifaciens]
MADTKLFYRLDSANCTVIFDCQRKTPSLLYFGKKLSEQTTETMLAQLATRQEVKCAVVEEAPISLSPLLGEGFTGAPGLELINDSIAWSVGPQLKEVRQPLNSTIEFLSVDTLRGIELLHSITLDNDTDVLSAHTVLTNLGDLPLNVNFCAAPTFPLPDSINKIVSFEGRWANEFQRQSVDLTLGSFVRENRKGKTSHDVFPGLLVHSEGAGEQHGECYGFHLGWSGNNKLRAELLPEGRRYVQMGELLLPGELTLSKGETYQSPNIYSSFSNKGFSALSRNFHRFVKANLLTQAQREKARPVHYNTWEGIYFTHDVDTLKELADKVAPLGVERFVLDDGWFKGRHDDNAGLGDWTVDYDVYPDGLLPIIEHVNGLGMEFGLWFEPEMVNPDSDLYRAHPDWVLGSENNEQLSFRNQFVLDLTRTEVIEYLYTAIHDILVEYPAIKYIKWDMNRDINHAGNFSGKPAVHQQTLALYRLIDRIKAAHPGLEIESCSSGGARVDYGVLAHTDRVWTSDSNDALDRLEIQRGCSFFFPSSVMGAHVGPRDCHITGRNVSIEMRAAVSMFGHMGIEMDPRELTDHEYSALKAAISLHKEHRDFIHAADLYRLDSDDLSINFGLIDERKSKALFAYNSVRETPRTAPNKLRFVGLDADAQYTLSLVWPVKFEEYRPSSIAAVNGQKFTGEALMQFGLQMPISFPQTSLVFELNKI